VSGGGWDDEAVGGDGRCDEPAKGRTCRPSCSYTAQVTPGELRPAHTKRRRPTRARAPGPSHLCRWSGKANQISPALPPRQHDRHGTRTVQIPGNGVMMNEMERLTSNAPAPHRQPGNGRPQHDVRHNVRMAPSTEVGSTAVGRTLVRRLGPAQLARALHGSTAAGEQGNSHSRLTPPPGPRSRRPVRSTHAHECSRRSWPS